jgi:hypothetical protein
MDGFKERNEAGLESEQYVRAELEQRGYDVQTWGREVFSPGINAALNSYRDTYGNSCALRWQPDFLIMQRGKPQSLRAVEVKRYYGQPKISRLAADALIGLDRAYRMPILIVFHCPERDEDHVLGVLTARQCLKLGGTTNPGNPETGSGEPLFYIDPRHLEPFDKHFGAKTKPQ